MDSIPGSPLTLRDDSIERRIREIEQRQAELDRDLTPNFGGPRRRSPSPFVRRRPPSLSPPPNRRRVPTRSRSRRRRSSSRGGQERVNRDMDELEEVKDMEMPRNDEDSFGSLPDVEERVREDRLDNVSELSFNLSEEGSGGRDKAVTEQRKRRTPPRRERRSPPRRSPRRRGRSNRSRERSRPYRARSGSRDRDRGRRDTRDTRRDRRRSPLQVRSVRPPPPPRPCLVCKSTEHVAKDCPDLICYNCQEGGHFAKECTNAAVKRKRDPKPPEINADGDEARSKPKININLVCYNCNDLGHHIKQCPKLDCKKCGGTGHFAKECPNESNQFKPPRYAQQKQQQQQYHSGGGRPQGGANRYPPSNNTSSGGNNFVSYDYAHSSTSAAASNSWTGRPSGASQPRKQAPTGSLREHLCRRYADKGKDPGLGDQIIYSWRMAGHSEESLKAFFVRENPANVTQFRLVLVKEFSNIQAAHIPPSINVGELLDETVSFFFSDNANSSSDNYNSGVSANSNNFSLPPPTGSSSSQPPPSHQQQQPTNSITDQLTNLQSALNSINSLERFRSLQDVIEDEFTNNGRRRNEYEGRLGTLETLRAYIHKRMSVVAELFGISENYISVVSATIQKLMAHVGLCMFTLQRMHSSYGESAIKEAVTEKLTPFSESFPSGVTVKYIVSMVCDCMYEVERGH